MRFQLKADVSFEADSPELAARALSDYFTMLGQAYSPASVAAGVTVQEFPAGNITLAWDEEPAAEALAVEEPKVE